MVGIGLPWNLNFTLQVMERFQKFYSLQKHVLFVAVIGSPKKGMKTNKLKTEVQMKENAAFWKKQKVERKCSSQDKYKMF